MTNNHNYPTTLYRGYRLAYNQEGLCIIYTRPFSSRRDKAGDWDKVSWAADTELAKVLVDEWLNAR